MAKLRILLVDDDNDLLDAIRDVCESMACDVDVAENGQAAMEKLAHNKYNLVITDIKMPKMDGMALLKAVHAEGIETPVVMMTAYSDYSEEQIDAEDGVSLIEKPFTRETLEEIIEQFLPLMPTG